MTTKEKWELRAKRLELSMEAIYITADPDYEAKVAAIDAEIERITEILGEMPSDVLIPHK